jgi:hypothetical protein
MNSTFTEKNCLVYYLLKEYGDGRENRFAIDRLIPSHFSRGLDGLWALDHSQWQVRCFLIIISNLKISSHD